ncbi:unnamed protein product, partial [marine sediment metagenome]
IEFAYIPEIEVIDIIQDLENLIEKVSGNAEVIPEALLRMIRIQQVIIKILRGEAS